MLIQLQGTGGLKERYPSPVVGLKRLEPQSGHERLGNDPVEHTPTSADVHLYADPMSTDSRTPLLYADCEGLEGGENPPIGAHENPSSKPGKKEDDASETFWNSYNATTPHFKLYAYHAEVDIGYCTIRSIDFTK
ncbi:uncharacterized protein J4E78_010406 [Alternaria triticimaculans]|uniref:uncharacterized protein n=1 Tax=Alternaria triticimaculans TaxID=297637 RepID=UPI0020C223F4|nr:uncharacterized protein J4E78_010406 [Alternaria triticimaculans]KAI4641434.1 hypothetical protein J4E78_010406 [Alternaria triticimaculans]